MKKNRLFKMIAVLGLSAMMLLSAGVTAFAAEGDEPTAEPSLAITKEFQMPEGTTTPIGSATFTFTKAGVMDRLNGVVNTDENNGQPEIADVEIAFTADDEGTTTNGVKRVIKESDEILNAQVKAEDFPRVGYYIYTLTENTDTFTLQDGETMDYSKAEYEVVFSVFGDEANPGKLKIAGVAVTEKKDDACADIEVPAKENAGKTPDGSGNDLRFVNKFVRQIIDGGLFVEKLVTGALGDQTAFFPFTVTVQDPDVMTADLADYKARAYIVEYKDGAWADISAEDAAKVSADAVTADGKSYIDFTSAAQTTVNLRHNMKLVFANVAVGSMYSVMENNSVIADGYTIFINHTVNGTAHTSDELFTENARIGESANSVVFTNDKQANPVTGILIQNLPYITLIAVAIGGLILFLISKSRKARKNGAR